MASQRQNPFVGPRSFRKGEKLYGRRRDLSNLLALLISERIVLFYAPSGAGKSSLIRAALEPALMQNDFAMLAIARVGHEPPDGFSLPPGANPYVFSVLLDLEESVPEKYQLPLDTLASMTLVAYMKYRMDTMGKDLNPLIVIEQFEEIVNLDPSDEGRRSSFFRQLGDVLQNEEIWALCVIREDYLASLDPYRHFIPTRFHHSYRMDLLHLRAAAEAIRMPAKSVGVDFTDHAIALLLDSLCRIRIRLPNGDFTYRCGETVEPVQLQVTCRRLFERLDEQVTRIDMDDLDEVGDVEEALAEYYAIRIGEIAERTGILEREIRNWIDHHLMTDHGFRSQVHLGETESMGLDNRVINGLMDAHLVRAEQSRGAIWLELSHDRMVNVIHEDNARWREEHLSVLQQQAIIWDHEKRPDSLLLRSKTLVEAEQWVAGHDSELTDLERLFLQECRLFRRKKRLALSGVISFILGLLFALIFSAWSWKQTERERTIAHNIAVYLEQVFQAGDPTAVGEMTVRDLLQKTTAGLLEEPGVDPMVHARLMSVMGSVHYEIADFERAIALQEAALTIYEDLGQSRLQIDALAALARTEHFAGFLQRAQEHAKRAVQLAETAEGRESVQMARALNASALVALGLGRLDDALAAETRAIRLFRRYEEVGEELALALQEMGRIHFRLNNFAQAETFYREALAMQSTLRGRDHPATVRRLMDLAGLLINTGRFEEAEAMYREILAMYDDLLGERHPRSWMIYNDLARLYLKRNNYLNAELCLRTALELGAEIVAEDAPFYLGLKANLGVTLMKLKKYDEAEAILEDTLETQIEVLGSSHVYVGYTTTYLAQTYEAMARPDKAEPLFREALAVARKAQGENHPRTTKLTFLLGLCLLELERVEEARALLDVRAQTHPTRRIRAALGLALSQQGRFDEGEPLLLAAWQEAFDDDGHNDQEKSELRDLLLKACHLAGQPDCHTRYRPPPRAD